MPWPSAQQAIALLVTCLVVRIILRRCAPETPVLAPLTEVAIMSGLYAIWRLARLLPLAQEAGAEQRGLDIWELQRRLHFPSELAIERWTARYRFTTEVAVDYYAVVHVPLTLGFLVWLFWKRRSAYSHWRTMLAITTGFCLVIRFWRVTPPRLLPELGFYDLALDLGRSVYGPPGTGISDQYAAMPSIHIAWAGVVCFGMWKLAGSRWRWIGPTHLALTFYAVVATANHWWLDGLVALILLWIAAVIDTQVRGHGPRLIGRLRGRRASPSEESRQLTVISA